MSGPWWKVQHAHALPMPPRAHEPPSLAVEVRLCTTQANALFDLVQLAGATFSGKAQTNPSIQWIAYAPLKINSETIRENDPSEYLADAPVRSKQALDDQAMGGFYCWSPAISSAAVAAHFRCSRPILRNRLA